MYVCAFHVTLATSAAVLQNKLILEMNVFYLQLAQNALGPKCDTYEQMAYC